MDGVWLRQSDQMQLHRVTESLGPEPEQVSLPGGGCRLMASRSVRYWLRKLVACSSVQAGSLSSAEAALSGWVPVAGRQI